MWQVMQETWKDYCRQSHYQEVPSRKIQMDQQLRRYNESHPSLISIHYMLILTKFSASYSGVITERKYNVQDLRFLLGRCKQTTASGATPSHPPYDHTAVGKSRRQLHHLES